MRARIIAGRSSDSVHSADEFSNWDMEAWSRATLGTENYVHFLDPVVYSMDGDPIKYDFKFAQYGLEARFYFESVTRHGGSDK